ncbi:MAG: hypothetical protein AAFV72_21095, partial [Cyanobacteria bacterium J06635_1]
MENPFKKGYWLALALPMVGILGYLGLHFVSYPSTAAIAKQYLAAIELGDTAKATQLGTADCQAHILHRANEDIDTYGGTEITNVEVQTSSGQGSNNPVEFAEIHFEYRRYIDSVPKAGQLTIVTDFEPIGLRKMICSD